MDVPQCLNVMIFLYFSLNHSNDGVETLDQTEIDKIVNYLPTGKFNRKSNWPQMFEAETISIFIQELYSPSSKPIAIYYLLDRPKESFIHYGNRTYKLDLDDIAFFEKMINPQD